MSIDLPKNVPLGKVIASRRLTLKGRPRAKAELRIGAPMQLRQDAYCPVQLVGVGDERVRPIYGVDRLQALQLALRYVEPLLLRFGDRLRWEGELAHKSLHTDPWALFENAGLSEFLSKFAELCANQAARLAPQRGRGSRGKARGPRTTRA
jgi:hypothetical protein